MQMNEDLIKQIVDAVMEQIGQLDDKAVAKTPAGDSSLAGRDRINEVKTDYSGYPRAKKGTDPKEIARLGYGRICHSSLLLRHERPAEDSGGSLLCIQQQLEQPTLEIRTANGSLERR